MDWKYYIDLLSQDQLQFIALPIFLLAIIVEWRIDEWRHLDLYKRVDSWVSLSMLIFTGIVEFIPKLLAFIAFIYLHEISPLRDIVGRQWWAWASLFLFDDFAYYWFHRMNHEVRLFWAGHVPHHSSVKLNYATALRQGVGERVHKYFFWIWIPLLGFDPLMMFTVISINLIYQFWVHTELVGKMPSWYEYVFNTPSHHRVHHASNVRYLDCNHAGLFILWDRLFGTFSEEKDFEKPIYGLTKNIDTYNPFKVVTHEYQAIWKDVLKASKWTDKLKYVFMAPGWSHDGKDLRAKTLRRELRLN
ncbi:MAG: sterol desaturase family protein [Saprospiraceae bacterium]|nr:sterol desaturase family protein [Saprospiraceae bacterium]|tara:strand:- start:5105 stop:6013 length:909 start_codon:yes stop_codon:yes gene_type:complete